MVIKEKELGVVVLVSDVVAPTMRGKVGKYACIVIGIVCASVVSIRGRETWSELLQHKSSLDAGAGVKWYHTAIAIVMCGCVIQCKGKRPMGCAWWTSVRVSVHL